MKMVTVVFTCCWSLFLWTGCNEPVSETRLRSEEPKWAALASQTFQGRISFPRLDEIEFASALTFCIEIMPHPDLRNAKDVVYGPGIDWASLHDAGVEPTTKLTLEKMDNVTIETLISNMVRALPAKKPLGFAMLPYGFRDPKQRPPLGSDHLECVDPDPTIVISTKEVLARQRMPIWPSWGSGDAPNRK